MLRSIGPFSVNQNAPCLCSTTALATQQPGLLIAIIVLIGILAVAVTWFLWRITRYIVLSIVHRRRITTQVVGSLSDFIPGASGALPGNNEARRVCVVADSAVWAACVGIIKPRVYVSHGLLEALHRRETLAVVRHELYHAAMFEPARQLVVHIVQQCLGYIPSVTAITRQYQDVAEIAADEFAVGQRRKISSLRKALYRVLTVYAPQQSAWHAAAGFGEAALDNRLDALLGRYSAAATGSARWSTYGILVLGMLLVSSAAFFVARPAALMAADDQRLWCEHIPGTFTAACVDTTPRCLSSSDLASGVCS